MSPAGDNKPIKPAGKGKPKAVRIIELPKKEASRSRWTWAVGGGLVLVLVIAGLMLLPARKNVAPTPTSSGAAGSAVGSNVQSPGTPTGSPAQGAPERDFAFLKAVRLQPSQPTRTDTLKAEVAVATGAPKRLVYTYEWKVNDRTVEGARDETLNLSAFKKKDRVYVTVTPYDGDVAGFRVVSPEVAIHSVAPSLDLEIKRSTSKIAEPIEMRLVSVAPDSDPRHLQPLAPPCSRHDHRQAFRKALLGPPA